MKVKSGFVAVALAVVTVGVFAGKPRFSNANLYANVSGTEIPIDNATSFGGFSTSGTHQAKIVSSTNGTTMYNLATFNGTSYVPLYTSGF